MYRKKKIIAYSIFILFLILLQIFLILLEHFGKKVPPDFDSLTHEILKSELESDTLSLHYTFADPTAYGLDLNTVCLPTYSKDSQQNSIKKIDNYLEQLLALSPSKLNTSDRHTLTLLTDYLTREREFLNYHLYEEPLSPSSGMQGQLPILLAEYAFYTETDILTYLQLLQEIDTYFEGLILFEQQKSMAGLFMCDESAEQVIAQCYSLFTSETLWKNNHFLQLSFEERVQELVEAGLLDETAAATYIAENTRILLEEVMPAYHFLGDSLYLLLGSGKNEGGLCRYDEGREYYALLLASATGSSKTPDELMTLLKERFSDEYTKLIELSQKMYKEGTLTFLTEASPQDNADSVNDDVNSVNGIDPEYPGITAATPEQNALRMLEDLQLRMAQDFPSIQNTSLTYDVKKVSDVLSPYCAPAFYLSPPQDALSANVIYVNQIEDYDTLLLYTTLAHEGFPGHLYQTVYHGIHATETGTNPITSLLYYGGYTEGWALYVENIAYEYAKEFMDNTDYVELCRLNRDVQLCLFSIIDIGIHYYDISYEQVCQMLSSYGITDEASLSQVYRYIVEEPSNYPKYYVGYLELLECRELAQEVLDDTYSDYEFHKLVLECGPADFDTVKKTIKQVIVN